MVKERKDELFNQFTKVLSQLKQRVDEINGPVGQVEEVAKVYLDQLYKTVKKIQGLTLDKADHLSRTGLEHYDELMASLIRPHLPLRYRGAPAYYLRDSYAQLSDLSFRLVQLRQQFVAQMQSNQAGGPCLKSSIDYFVAPKSELVLSLWGNWIRRRIVLPVLVLWDGCRRIGNYLLGGFFMRNTILPALNVKDWRCLSLKNHSGFDDGFEDNFDWDENMQKHLPDGICMKRFHLVDENSSVACIELLPEGVDPSNPELKTVIYFLGNLNICYASLPVFLDDMKSVSSEGQPCRFVFWHYPGVLNSFGVPSKPADLVRCGLGVVEHVLDEGGKAENLILKGHSLGGYVATHVAYCCHHMKLWVKVWSDRSFSDSPAYMTACAVTCWDSGYRLRHYLLRIAVYATYPLMWLVTRLVRCEVPAFYFMTRLKQSCVDYIVVRSTPEVRAEGKVLDDVIVQDSASLDVNWWFRFCAWWRGDSDLQEHHYYTPTRLEEDAHQAPLKMLLPSFKKTKESAQRRFARFVARRS